ncbi:MAG: methyltransferase domain-containing protein [Deltaproteobacteria bacterium]|nr:methyltransferase domain-containing protein [Deltaproteobacteria bacterium]
MQSIQTCFNFDLSKVKPLEEVLKYRTFCLEAVRQSCRGGTIRRNHSPVSGARLLSWGTVDGLEYGICPKTGSLFLTEIPAPAAWASLLDKVNRYRNEQAFDVHLKQSRLTSVYEPKKAWIEDTLRWHHLERPKVLEVTTPPSELTALLQTSPLVEEVVVWNETNPRPEGLWPEAADAAILLESLDRSGDPAAFLKRVHESLKPGGLLFLTALLASGFDMKVLGTKNLYLCPPDRTNCFSLNGLTQLLAQSGFTFIEVSTPGILDVEIVRAHCLQDPSIRLSPFETTLLDADPEKLSALQIFLQQSNVSSFARVVAKKN